MRTIFMVTCILLVTTPVWASDAEIISAISSAGIARVVNSDMTGMTDEEIRQEIRQAAFDNYDSIRYFVSLSHKKENARNELVRKEENNRKGLMKEEATLERDLMNKEATLKRALIRKEAASERALIRKEAVSERALIRKEAALVKEREVFLNVRMIE